MSSQATLDDVLRVGRRTKTSRAVAWLVVDYAAVVALAAAAEWASCLPVTAVVWVLIAGRQMALWNLRHTAAHGSFFDRRTHVDKLAYVLGYPLLASIRSYRPMHLQHHRKFSRRAPERYAFLHGDLKLDRASNAGRTWIVFVRPLLGYESFVFFKDTYNYLRERPSLAVELAAFWLLVGVPAGLFGAGRYIVLYWLAPLPLVFPVLYLWAEISDHLGAPFDSRNQAGLFYYLLLKGHELYHAVHHRFPTVPFYNLPALHSVLLSRGETPVACRGPMSFVRSVYERGSSGP